MPTSGLVALLLAAGLAGSIPFTAYATEIILAEPHSIESSAPVPLEEPGEPLPEPPPTTPEAPADTNNSEPPLPEQILSPSPIEAPQAPTLPVEEPAAVVLFSASEEDPEPELVWDCQTTLDENGDPYEQCGLGYHRTSCVLSAGIEECTAFFEFYEEEEYDYFADHLTALEKFRFLNLSLTWNGSPLPEGANLQNANGTLGWTYSIVPNPSLDLPPSYKGSFEEMFAGADLTLQIYEGSVGSATLVASVPVTGSMSGTIPLSPVASSTYHVALVASYTKDSWVPGFQPGGGGDFMLLFEPRIESFAWMMQHAAAYLRDFEEPIGDPSIFYEYGSPKNRLDTSFPLAYGMQQITTGGTVAGTSNVLFLPGIKGSRLYRPSDTCDPLLTLSCPGVKLWEPSGNVLLEDLFLTSAGDSGRSDIYAKEDDIVSEVLGANFYASFVNQMDALVADGTIARWKPAAYDWRLSLEDIVTRGTTRDEKIFYREATTDPYIEKTLKELAAESPNGKVSIVAHSNGGLVAKKLLEKLEAKGELNLVDKIIFVGVPQSGAPQAVAALLFGYGEALPRDECSQIRVLGIFCSLFGSRDMARDLAEHSPMAYHLLPSERYFEQVQDAAHPVAVFNATTVYAAERARYGNSIDTTDELSDFLAARDGGRSKPEQNDIASPNVLPGDLLAYGRSVHADIDAWVPPPGVKTYQIAGWGVPTIAGIEFYEQKKLLGGHRQLYRPLFVEDGDGVVPTPSALMLSTSYPNIHNYWLNLEDANSETRARINHGNIFEVDELRTLVRDILLDSVESLPSFVSETQPISLGGERLVFFLHSPLTLELYDDEGHHIGETQDGGMDDQIPGATYGEFGDVKYIIAPTGNYAVSLRGMDSGTFTLEVQSISDNRVVSSISIADVPTTDKTTATMAVSGDLAQAGVLRVDADTDGIVDIELQPIQDSVVSYTAPSEPERIKDTSSRPKNSQKILSEDLVSATITPSILMGPVASQITTEIQTSAPVKRGDPIIEAQEEGRIEATTDNAQNLTASVYDSLGTGALNWLGAVLYNLWQVLLERVADLFLWR